MPHKLSFFSFLLSSSDLINHQLKKKHFYDCPEIIQLLYQSLFSLQYKKKIEQWFGFAPLNRRLKEKNTSLFKGKDNVVYF